MPALVEYAVPVGNNGVGFHGSPSYQQPFDGDASDNYGYDKNLAYYQNERRQGITWYKVLGDGSQRSIWHVKAIADAGIEPVIRLYADKPSPYHVADYRVVAAYVAVGAHYFEYTNEPNLALEWAGMPSDGVVIGHTFVVALCYQIKANIEQISRGGGVALIPAMAPGNESDPIDTVCYNSVLRWFEIATFDDGTPAADWLRAQQQAGHVAVATHARFGDHFIVERGGGVATVNLDYPNDPINEAEHPGVTLWQDNTAFRSYELVDDLMTAFFREPVPIIDTESGAEVGDDWDSRYEKVSRESHWLVNREIILRMNPAHPKAWRPSLFAVCFWVRDLLHHGAFLSSPWKNNPIHGENGGDLPAAKGLEGLAASLKFVRIQTENGEGEPTMIQLKAEDFGIPANLQHLLDPWVASNGVYNAFMRHAAAVKAAAGDLELVTPDMALLLTREMASVSGQAVFLLNKYVITYPNKAPGS